MKSEILARRSFKQRALNFITKDKLTLILFTLLGIIAAAFIISAFLANKGSFTITLPREQMINLGLVISDTSDFSRKRYEILAPPVIDMWNITRDNIPENVNEIDGSHNGQHYLAMTVYLKNTGDKNLEYTANLDLTEVYRNVDEALRVELYVNDVSTIYAKRRGGWSGQPEPETVPFLGISRIISLEPKPINIGQVEKFTIVSWIEGNDPDCINDLLGGYVKMAMSFSGTVIKE